MRKIFKKLIILTYRENVDCNGILFVDNQEIPYKYSNLTINIDVRPRSYEPYIELERKIKIKLYGLHGKTWFYLFEPSIKSWIDIMQISKSTSYNKENISWDIKVVPRNDEEDVPLYGVIIHAHKLSDLYDSMKKIDKKAEENFMFKHYENFYLKGSLYSTNIEEKCYLYILDNDEELKNFLSILLEKKIEVLGYEYELAK
jgi:hypothetical protein